MPKLYCGLSISSDMTNLSSIVTARRAGVFPPGLRVRSILTIGLIGLLAHTLSAAESSPQDKIVSATRQLGAKPNYSWTTTTKEGDGNSRSVGPIDGKADKGGLTFLSFSIGGIPVEVFMNGQKGAAKALEGWQTFDEIAQTSGTAAAVVRFLRSYKAPGIESAALSAKVKDVKDADGILSGELKEDAAKELLESGARRREWQEPPKIENPKGSVKFWIQNGALTKYEVNIQGKVTAGDRESEVNRTTTVEIKDAGSTKLELPADAKQKMS
jgi:hypothetical protein